MKLEWLHGWKHSHGATSPHQEGETCVYSHMAPVYLALLSTSIHHPPNISLSLLAEKRHLS